MRRLAAGLAAAALLWLAPLAHADITYYVNGFGGGASDVYDSTAGNLPFHGTHVNAPWATMSYAMQKMRQPNATNGNIILQIADCPVGQDYTGSSQIKFNPVKKPSGGYRYTIIGNLTDSTLVRFSNGSTQITLDSTDVTWKGIWFKSHVNIYDETVRMDAVHTRHRMYDSLISCRIGTDFSNGDIYVNGSNVTVDKINMTGGVYVGKSNSGGGRRRGVSNHFYNITSLNPTNVSYNFFSVGLRKHDTTPVDIDGNPATSLYEDSLRIWFCNFSGTVHLTPSSGSELEEGGMFIENVANGSLRSNHWTWLQIPGEDATRADKTRDSLTDFHRDCDTVVCVGRSHTVLWFFNEVDFVPAGVNQFVDSCYFQIYKQEFQCPMGSSWTYTTFVTGNGFESMSPKTLFIDSTSVNTFNHCNFISTNGSNSIVPFGTMKTTRGPTCNFSSPAGVSFGSICYPWPVTINDGSRMVFKNNIICRADKSIANTTDKTKALVTWGLTGMTGTACGTSCANKNVARKITTDWNLYATINNTGTTTGDLSVGWTNSGSALSCAPGTTSAFKTQMDTDWADTDGAGGDARGTGDRSSYDSLSVYCPPGGIDWSQWTNDSSSVVKPVGYDAQKPFDWIWDQGQKIDLTLGANSIARYNGEGGSDIGAVQSSATSIASCAASNDTCNNLVVTDYSPADTTLNIRFINNGTQTLTISSPLSYSPAGSYNASTEGLTLTTGQTGYLQIRVTDPPFEHPTGTYYLDITLTTSDVGNPRYHLNITIFRNEFVTQ